MERKERRRGWKSGSSYVLWEARRQPSLFTTQLLNVSFCKGPCVFLVFPLLVTENAAETLGGGKKSRRSWIRGLLEQNFKHSTSKVNDMHLIPMSPNKDLRERFHTHTHKSRGLSKEKRWSLLGLWAFQCAVSAPTHCCLFFFFHYLFAQLFRDGSFLIDHLSFF